MIATQRLVGLAAAVLGATVLGTVALGTSALQAADVELNGKHFTLAEGLTIELAATAPLTERPICVDFDDQGRLYVAESSGTNDPVQKQLAERPHSILRLEDTDGDGVFDKRTVFAERLMFPEGCEWHDGSLYVGAPPQIWKFTDTNDDGVADEREVWFDGQTLTGCANDLHGPYTGPDGLLYWCKGAFAEQTHEQPSGKPFVTRASHIFRHDPRGRFVEPILTGGMDNPVEVAFTRDGEPILSCTFLQRPAGGHRDGLIHAAYGGVWGKVNGALDGHIRTGELMPPLVHMGPAAPCGLTRLCSDAWGTDDTLLTCSFNLHKVFRHVLRPQGATFAASGDDLLSSDDVDFHPTDVIEDADGSLLVIDTGGWYKLCCPTSQLHKPDVPGAIYRIRRADAKPVDDARGLNLVWNDVAPSELAARLGDPRFAVRQRAMSELARRGGQTIDALEDILSRHDSADVRRRAVWTLTRITDQKARKAIRRAIGDDDAGVRRVAIRSAGLWRDEHAAGDARRLLSSNDPHTARVAAEALSRLGDERAVYELLALAARADDDRFLHHAATYALIRIAAPTATRAGLTAESPGAARAALLALDQMPDGDLIADQVIERLGQPELRETALFVLDRHSEWGDAVADFLRDRMAEENVSQNDFDDLRPIAARFAGRPAVQALLAEEAARDGRIASRQLALAAMASSGLKAFPAEWTTAVASALETQDERLVPAAVEAASAVKKHEGDAAKLRAALSGVAGSTHPIDDVVRLQALRAASTDGAALTAPSFGFLLKQLGDDETALRLMAADVAATAKLTPAQLRRVAALLPELGPMELDRVILAFAKASDDKTGLALVAALEDTSAAADLVPEKLRAAFAKFGPTVAKAARPLLERPEADAAERASRIDELLPAIATADPRQGQAIFQSSRSACASCHAVGYVGGKIGPDLTRIGQIRTERDLLEAILYPSASFVQSFQPVVVLTVEGMVHSGVPQDESEDSITLVTAADKTITIARDDIEEMRPGSVSIMPAGLEKQLTPQELADLVAFLKTAR